MQGGAVLACQDSAARGPWPDWQRPLRGIEVPAPRHPLELVLPALTEGAQPDTIILKRFMHKRYRGEAVELASTAAGILATINRAIASTQRPSDKRCRTCPASTDQVLLTMKLALMDDPTEYVRSPMHMLAGLRMCLPRIACEQAEACFDSALNKTESRPTERT